MSVNRRLELAFTIVDSIFRDVSYIFQRFTHLHILFTRESRFFYLYFSFFLIEISFIARYQFTPWQENDYCILLYVLMQGSKLLLLLSNSLSYIYVWNFYIRAAILKRKSYEFDWLKERGRGKIYKKEIFFYSVREKRDTAKLHLFHPTGDRSSWVETTETLN